MKLTKEQIQFIDNYLIKNEVKFWDVRLELLDHIISAVEGKINNKQFSFNDALLEVHEGFGNKLGHYRNPTFEERLYYSNKGFIKFTFQKQKEIGRKARRNYWKTLAPFLYSFKFLLEFVLILITVSVVYRFNQKTAFIVAMIFAVIPVFIKMFYGVFNKSTWKSLKMTSSMIYMHLIIQLCYWVNQGFKSYYQEASPKPYIVLVFVYIILFPFFRHGLNVFIKSLKENKRMYKLMLS